MFLFFDTETTGLPNYNLELIDPAQPHIVQLAMILTDEDGREMGTFKAPIVPDGFTIDERLEYPDGRKTAFAVNRIGNEAANRYGFSLPQMLALFKSFEKRATVKVAHNYRFDGFLLKCAHARAGMEQLDPPIDKFCTLKTMTEVMKLPPTDKMRAAGFSQSKSAKLSEAYKFCTGKELENAHDALADVRACKEVFFWIKNQGLYVPQPRVGPKVAA